MKIGKCLIAATALLATSACNGSKKADTNVVSADAKEVESPEKTGGKALVVFFSHAGDNYSVGDIQVGNTKIVADYISEFTGADQFELVTHKYDGMAYKPLCDLAQQEQRDNELPEYEGSVDVSGYQTIFIGGPVWWGTYPQVMFTFFSKVDLSGKNVIPFTTHEGSGLANCVADVKKAFPKAKVAPGFAIYGHDARSGKSKVKDWLTGLKLVK